MGGLPSIPSHARECLHELAGGCRLSLGVGSLAFKVQGGVDHGETVEPTSWIRLKPLPSSV